jgi:hypothetical protein
MHRRKGRDESEQGLRLVKGSAGGEGKRARSALRVSETKKKKEDRKRELTSRERRPSRQEPSRESS